ncbi:hypothetical protein [Streptomyces tibetensis]|uniref:hypothetical protein n=1 Tax=Streptomyces tibetensis TaxID=2382123 RepID=UPI003403A7BA
MALLSGHVAVALAAALALAAGSRPDRLALVSTLVVLTVLVPVWYRSAVTATDEWAAAVRALVNTGRKPLAASLGLALPQTLAAERDMWTMVPWALPHPLPRTRRSPGPLSRGTHHGPGLTGPPRLTDGRNPAAGDLRPSPTARLRTAGRTGTPQPSGLGRGVPGAPGRGRGGDG